ncbi:transposase [Anaerococcus porci]|uniref:transposase n=1 Tax=Anaerococcus TaxID=165779 RepID=UPI003898F589
MKRYDEDFKMSIVSLHENGRSINSLAREYGVSVSTVAKCTKLYASVSTETGEVFTAKQIKVLQKRNAILEKKI